MIIGTFRPIEITLTREGKPHPLEGVVAELKRYHGNIVMDLSNIGDAAEFELVNQLIDIEPNDLGVDFRRFLHRQTNGNPLFVVELLKEMKENGALLKNEGGFWVQSPHLAWNKLPARVEGVIERRINRLSTQHRALLTIGCVEGEEFTAEVIAQAETMDTRGVVNLLSGELDKKHQLVSASGVHRLGYQRLSHYHFQHNLFQKYLYNSLDEVERSYFHEDVGLILEEIYGAQATTIAVQLARHFKEAGIHGKAVQYLYQAGIRALHLSAYQEAVAHFREGLALLASLPENQERDQQELPLQIMLGQALIATEGYAAKLVEVTFTRARQICEQLGETPQRFPALWGLWAFYEVKGQYKDAMNLAQNLLQLAESAAAQDLMILAHFAVGNTLFMLGRLDESIEHLAWVQDHYEFSKHGSLSIFYGQDPAVTALSWKSCAEWLLGYPDLAVETSQAAIQLARKLDHAFSLAYSLYCATWLYQLLREVDPLQTYARELIPLSKERGFPFWLSTGLIQQGWAIAQENKYEDAITQMNEAIGLWKNIGAGIGEPYYLSLMAEVLGVKGQVQDGFDLILNARQLMTDRDERWVEPILDLVEGELYLIANPENVAQAESVFLHALETARDRKMNSLVLRAASCLEKLGKVDGNPRHGKVDPEAVYQAVRNAQ
jgi:predicted ATPase